MDKNLEDAYKDVARAAAIDCMGSGVELGKKFAHAVRANAGLPVKGESLEMAGFLFTAMQTQVVLTRWMNLIPVKDEYDFLTDKMMGFAPLAFAEKISGGDPLFGKYAEENKVMAHNEKITAWNVEYIEAFIKNLSTLLDGSGNVHSDLLAQFTLKHLVRKLGWSSVLNDKIYAAILPDIIKENERSDHIARKLLNKP